MAGERSKSVSIMIVPEDGAHIRNWRMSTRRYRLLQLGLGLVALLLIGGILSFFSALFMGYRLYHYRTTNRQLVEAASRIEIITARLADYEEKERKLRGILGGDIKLPEAQTIADVDSLGVAMASAGGTASPLAELDAAIVSQESRLRRIPSIWPVEAWQITKEFSRTGNPRLDHLGIDILAWGRSPVVATADGQVTFADMSDDLGLRVLIDHGSGWETEYGHNSVLLVKFGDQVRKGQTIAIYGGIDTAGSGPHLHYAMHYHKQPVNPLDYLKGGPLAMAKNL